MKRKRKPGFRPYVAGVRCALGKQPKPLLAYGWTDGLRSALHVLPRMAGAGAEREQELRGLALCRFLFLKLKVQATSLQRTTARAQNRKTTEPTRRRTQAQKKAWPSAPEEDRAMAENAKSLALIFSCGWRMSFLAGRRAGVRCAWANDLWCPRSALHVLPFSKRRLSERNDQSCRLAWGSMALNDR
ncbi:hypothetical protein ACFLXI_05180 [Chloroflexota bacterium]